MLPAARLATCAAMAAGLASVAHADILVDWDVANSTPAGQSTAGPIPVNSTATDLSASALTTVGVGDVASTGNKKDSLGGQSWNYQAFDIDDEYIGFTITPENGAVFNLGALYFNEAANNTFGAPAQWQLRSSVDAFASTIASGTITSGFQDIASAGYTVINLPSSFDAVSNAVEFRLYGTDFSTFSNQWFVANPSEGPYANFTLDGVLVPEPASMALIGLGGFAMIRRRR